MADLNDNTSAGRGCDMVPDRRSPSSKTSDYAEQPRRNVHHSGPLNVRRGIIRVSALWVASCGG
jgi:hypothetical protein